MLAPFISLFILSSLLLTNFGLPVFAATWNETVTGANLLAVSGEGLHQDYITSTNDPSLPADELLRLETTWPSNAEEEHIPSPQLNNENLPKTNTKKQARTIMRLVGVAGAYFAIFFSAILMRRHAGILAETTQAQLDEEEDKGEFAALPLAEPIHKKEGFFVGSEPAGDRRRAIKAARAVEDVLRITQTKDMMALQRQAAALEALVGSAESKETLQQLQSAAKQTADAKELALKAQKKVLHSPDSKEKQQGGIEAKRAVEQLQKHREKMIKCSLLLLQQATAASSTRKETAAAAAQRIDEHATNIKQIFDGFQVINLNENVDGEQLKPHIELLERLQQHARVQIDKLDSAFLNIKSVNVHATSRSALTTSLYELSAELEAAAEAARKVERIDYVLEAMDDMAEAWADRGTKAAKDTLTILSGMIRTWAADSLMLTDINMTRIKCAENEVPVRKHKELLALANLLKEKLEYMLDERIQPNTPLHVAIKNMKNNDRWYGQLVRAGRDAGKMQQELYGKGLLSVDELDAETQQDVRRKELQSARLSAEICEEALASLTLAPYGKLEGAAAKAAGARTNNHYEVALQELQAAREALKEAEVSEDLMVLQKKTQAAREFATLGAVKALETAEANAEVNCWLQLEEDLKVIYDLAYEGQGKDERIAANLEALRSKRNLFAALSFFIDTLQRELQSSEEAALRIRTEEDFFQPPTDTPGERISSDAWEAAFERLVSTVKREMAEQAQRVERAVLEGLNLCRQPGCETPASQAAIALLRDVQLKAAAAQAAFRESLGTLMQAQTKYQAKFQFAELKAKKMLLSEALAEAERVLQDLEARIDTTASENEESEENGSDFE